jgi:putative protein-disulfide isomerase
MPPHLLYIADPMCSWCWGFSPVIDQVRNRFGEKLPMRLLMGGLRPGTDEPMSFGVKADIREHWQHVRKASGQPFDFAFFERDGFVYDTEPPSRAVVVMRRLDPDRVFDYFKNVQEAFYAKNLDVTDPAVLSGMAADIGLDREAFTADFKAGQTVTETWRDFEISRRLGITGFPTLLAGSNEGGYEIITAGYRPWEKVKEEIEDFGLRIGKELFDV